MDSTNGAKKTLSRVSPAAMDNINGAKKTLGRRKIEIKKIEKKASLQVTFTKRRLGLFRKASELSVLCGAELAILVKSPAEKIFAFGHPSVDALVDRFENGSSSEFAGLQIVLRDENRSKYEDALRRLEREKRAEEKERTAGRGVDEREFWWDEELKFDDMELHELEEYLESLESLRGNVLKKVQEMEKVKLLESFNSSANNFAVYGGDQGFDPCKLPIQFSGQDFHKGFNVGADDKIQMMEKESASGSSSNLVTNPTPTPDDFNEDFYNYNFQDSSSFFTSLN